MGRLNTERQRELEPKRLDIAENAIIEAGYDVISKDDTKVTFMFNGSLITYFAYSGWASGKTIKDGRGLKHLINQIKK
jgi:hypothetical protein